MNVPLEWVWENDPQGLPDDDHARCIAARGERYVAWGGQLFVLTTHPGASSVYSGCRRIETLQMEYLGLDWPRGLAQRYWSSDPFRCGVSGAEGRHSAGLVLLETVAGALAAGSTVGRQSQGPSFDSEDPSPRIGFDDLRQPERPFGWPPRVRAHRRSFPALLPLVVGPRRDRG